MHNATTERGSSLTTWHDHLRKSNGMCRDQWWMGAAVICKRGIQFRAYGNKYSVRCESRARRAGWKMVQVVNLEIAKREYGRVGRI